MYPDSLGNLVTDHRVDVHLADVEAFHVFLQALPSCHCGLLFQGNHGVASHGLGTAWKILVGWCAMLLTGAVFEIFAIVKSHLVIGCVLFGKMFKQKCRA